MKRFRFNSSAVAIAAGLLLAGAHSAAAQQPVPIDGVTGTIALEGAAEQTRGAIKSVVLTTMDGIEHLVHFAGRGVVHGGKTAGAESLSGLAEGSTIAVHLTNDAEARTVEGVITHIDRDAKTISIRLDDGTRQTLRLTGRAAADYHFQRIS